MAMTFLQSGRRVSLTEICSNWQQHFFVSLFCFCCLRARLKAWRTESHFLWEGRHRTRNDSISPHSVVNTVACFNFPFFFMLGFTTAEWRRDPFKTLLLENFFRFRSSHLMHLCCLGDSEFNPHQSLLLTGYLPTRGLSPLKTGLLKCTLPLLKESVFPVQVKVNTICISSSSCLSLAQPLSQLLQAGCSWSVLSWKFPGGVNPTIVFIWSLLYHSIGIYPLQKEDNHMDRDPTYIDIGVGFGKRSLIPWGGWILSSEQHRVILQRALAKLRHNDVHFSDGKYFGSSSLWSHMSYFHLNDMRLVLMFLIP